MNKTAPEYLCEQFLEHNIANYHMRNATNKFTLPKPRMEIFKRFRYSGAKQWNELPVNLRTSQSLRKFIKVALYTHINLTFQIILGRYRVKV